MNKVKSFHVKKFIGENSALAALLFILVIAVLLKGTTFLNARNLLNIVLNNSIIGIISLGMTLVIITGGIDLAAGSQLAATGLIAIFVMNGTQNIFLGLLAAVLTGIATGMLTGGLIAKFKIPAFIVTLGTMSIYRSLAQYFFKGGGIMAKGEVANGFIAISNTKLFGFLPMPILYWVIFSLIIAAFASRTASGRHIYAVGSNEKATKLSGINVDKVKLITYGLSGALVSLAAIIEASRLGSMNSASSGSSYEMDAIAAVVVGGTSMSGGKGRILGTVFGTLTLGIINNMMNLLGIPTFLVAAIKGFIIIAAVLLQKLVNKGEQ